MAALELEGVRIDRGARLWLAGAVLLLAGLNFLRYPHGFEAWATCLLEAMGAALVFARVRRLRSPRRTPVRMRADSAGLWLDGRLVARRGVLKTGHLVPGAVPSVCLVGRGGPLTPLELEVASEAEGRALLRALDLDVTRNIARFRVIPQRLTLGGIPYMVLVGPLLVGAIAGVATAVEHPPLWVVPVIATIAVLASIALAQSGVLDIGADGLLLRESWRRRFVPYDELAEVQTESDGGLQVALRSGEKIRISFGAGRMGNQQPEVIAARDAARARIEEAARAFALARAPVSAEALLAPGTRATRDWVRAVSGLRADASYRAAELPPERLWQMVEDPSTAATTRAGAALALGPSLGTEERARLQAAARTSASPRLRVALERLSERDEQESALEEALDVLRRD